MPKTLKTKNTELKLVEGAPKKMKAKKQAEKNAVAPEKEKAIKKLEEQSKGIIEGVAENLEKTTQNLSEKKGVKESLDNLNDILSIEAQEKDSAGAREEKQPKKREIKMLSEKELKKIMTDTRETLVPLTDYIKCSVHLGTRVITPDMRKYVYKRRADGLAVINTNLIDDKLREAVKFFVEYEPNDIFISCKRESAWPAVEKFSEVTGIRCFTKKYPAGIITNLKLGDFFETKAVIVCDPWIDKNALNDAMTMHLPVFAICDTNNYTNGVAYKIVGNNKSSKSIGLVLFVLAREYLKAKGRTKEAKALNLEDFTGKLDEMEFHGGLGESDESKERAPSFGV